MLQDTGARYAARGAIVERSAGVRRILAATAAVLLTLGACNPGASSGEPGVEDAWVRLPAAPGRPGAAYFTLRGGSDPSVLTAVSSPQSEKAELHESRMENGVMRMGPLASVDIPAGGEVGFEPGGRHVMLFGIDPSLEPGDSMTIAFRLAPEREIVVEAEVRGPGGGHAAH